MLQLSKYTDHVYALLRILSGFMFSFHGIQKIFGVLRDSVPAIGSQVWFGGLIEMIGGLLIMLGFQTRWAAFISSGTMAVAYIQFHWKFQFSAKFLPAINRGELAVVYCFLFLFFATKGGVIWCLDKKDNS